MKGALGRYVMAPFIPEDYVREVPVAPDALAGKLRSTINVRPKRAFGVLKVSAEWIGVVTGTEFVVWERRQHATRVIGRIRARRGGGSRVDARIEITRRTWVLQAVFLALFVVASIGLLSREGGLGFGPTGLSMAALGGFVLLALFWSASLRQRSALKAFLNEVFRAPERQ